MYQALTCLSKRSKYLRMKGCWPGLKQLRQKKGYSNYENFAFDHDIPRAQFGRYENGQDLRYTSLIKVIDALGVTVEEFFSEGFDQ